MSRALLAASLIGIAMLPGCGGPEKELPKSDAVATERGPEVEPAAPVPATSQPDAVKFVEICLAAATEGHPERLEKAKTNRQTAKGRWKWQEQQITDATREYQGVWPDRTRVAFEFSSGSIKKFLFLFRQHSLQAFVDDGSGSKEVPDSKDVAVAARVEAIGDYWLPLLVPFADPKTIVFGLKKEPLGMKAVDTLRVSIPNCPLFTVWFDEMTHLPLLITYLHVETGTRVQKHILLGEHKFFNGVKLPSQIEARRNGVTVQEWSITSWEFPYKIDDAVFDQPVKK